MPEKGHGLILLAIDDFAAIGGLFGEDVAVALAYAAEARLWSSLPEGAGSWPSGRGEFAIVLPDISPGDLLALARQLQARLGSEPLQAPSGRVELTASAGCALARPSMLRHLGASAARALAAARRRGRGRANLVCAEPDRQENILRAAQRSLATGTLALAFQPILPLVPAVERASDFSPPTTPRPALYTETLLRLPLSPDEPLLPAADFLPGLRAAGETSAVDRFTLREALERLRAEPRLRLGIHVARETLCDTNWHSTLATAAKEPAPPTDRLVVEISVDTLAEDPVSAGIFAERARRSGAALAIEDYLPGALEPQMLESLQPDFLKTPYKTGAWGALLKPVVALAARRDITLIATGLETTEAVDEARASGIAFGQGFALAPPAPDTPETDAPSLRTARATAPRSGSASH
ncbi:MAG: EAL domain-containing protein [Pseudomonadota bacterium]